MPKPVSISPGWSDERAGSCGRPSSRRGARPPSAPEGATLSAGVGAEGGKRTETLRFLLRENAFVLNSSEFLRPIPEFCLFSALSASKLDILSLLAQPLFWGGLAKAQR